ncbi:MAG: hypothetical protein OEM29_08545 [Thermoplasmata archaeon]|nr:hypothetical protein [Thermoplasmata archaeon]
MNEAVSKFLERISDIRGDYKGIEAYVLAFKWQGQWVSLCTRAILTTEKPKNYRFEGRIPDIPELLIDKQFLPIASLDV